MATHGPVSGRTYILSWIALLVLTGASFGATYLPLGALSPVLAFTIATGKAVVVVLVFMHLLEARFATRVVVLVTFLFIILLCLGITADVAYR